MNILGRPLTFGDEEQINFIKDEEIKMKLRKDAEFDLILGKYRNKENEISELEDEREELYEELVIIADKYKVTRNELYKFI